MALQVWLLLTKDLRNQGVSNLAFTNNNAVYSSTGGKLGGCYTFTSQTISAVPTTELKNSFNNAASISCWVKVSSSHSEYAQCVTYGTVSTAWTAIYFGIDINGSGVPIGNIANGSNYTNCSFVTAIKDNQWHHLCFTYTTGTIKSYLDGVLKKTVTTSYTPAWTNATIFTIGGNSSEVFKNGDAMNDVRLYNHCLSPLEVKYIAQGLMLHYPLNRNGFGQINLLKGTPKSVSNSSYCAYQLNMDSNLVADKTYTLQLWDVNVSHSAKTVAQTGVWIYWGGGSVHLFNWAGSTYFTNGHADYLVKTFTVTSSQASGSGASNAWFNVYNSVGYVEGTLNLTIGKWKLEEGSIPTPWCPNSSDALATTMGLNGTTEYDTSGFCNNGTRTGTFTWTSDAPKYNVSTVFPASASTYLTNTSTFSGVQTVSFWLKFLEIPNGSVKVFSDTGSKLCFINSGNSTSSQYAFNFYLQTYTGTSADKTNDLRLSTSSFDIAIWHFFTIIILNDGTLKFYIDGVEHAASGKSSQSNLGTGLVIGTSNKSFEINDFRMYATALSASDVKSLYQNCATIDPDGTIHGQIRS